MAKILVLNYRLEQHTRTVYQYLTELGCVVFHCPLMDAIDDSFYGPMPQGFISVPAHNRQPMLGDSRIVREQVFFTTDISSSLQLWRRRKEIELVIIHGLFVLPTPMLVICARLLGKPIIGQVFLRPLKYELKRSKIIHILRRTYFRSLDIVLAAGDLRILESYQIPHSKVRRFSPFIDFAKAAMSAGNGVDHTSFRTPGRPTIGYVGQLFHLKGLEELLQAYILLRNEFPTLSLVLIGGSPPESGAASCEALLREIIRKNSLTDVEITGWISRDEVQVKLRALDVFVFPSRGDTYPKAVMEAMATGIPVALSDACGSVGSLAVHNESAIVFEARDVAGIEDSVRKLLDDDALRSRIAREGQKRIAQCTVDRVISAYRDTISSVTNGPN
jgi:glycosyltransferase involved in cell wall biosynthesis